LNNNNKKFFTIYVGMWLKNFMSLDVIGLLPKKALVFIRYDYNCFLTEVAQPVRLFTTKELFLYLATKCFVSYTVAILYKNHHVPGFHKVASVLI